jgi:hypothetical protein
MRRIFLSLAGIVTLFSMTAAPVQSVVLVTPAPLTQAKPDATTFIGTILKNGDNFVLNDSAAKSRYTLDDPEKARAYEGMTVKVIGTIDMISNLIHVETIQEIA